MIDFREVEICPYCSSDEMKTEIANVPDKLDQFDFQFSIKKCLNCKLAFTNPRPFGDLSELYPENYLSRKTDPAKPVSLLARLMEWYREDVYSFDLKLAEKGINKKISKVKSVVDIGCGTGERVEHLRKSNKNRTIGLDLYDFWNVPIPKEEHYVQCSILDYKPEEKFEVVLIMNVLEHVLDFEKDLEHIVEHVLEDGGYLIIQIPNYDCLEIKFFGKTWAALDVPKHLWHFTPKFFKENRMKKLTLLKSFQKTAPLHPATTWASMFPSLDISKIWINSSKESKKKTLLKEMLWMVGTVLTIPIGIFLSLIGRGAQLTVVFREDTAPT